MNWGLLIAGIAALAAVASAIDARRSSKQSRALVLDNQIPLLTFSRSCPEDWFDGVILNIHNHGVGPALALLYVWNSTPTGGQMQMTQVPDDKPSILPVGEFQSIKFSANWLAITFDEPVSADPSAPRLIGTLEARYKDLHGRIASTRAELRFTSPSNEMGTCESTAFVEEVLALPNGETVMPSVAPDGTAPAYSSN